MVSPWLRASVLAGLAWVCLTFGAAAATPTFPALTGRVVDDAGLLAPADRQALTDTLAGLEAKTTDQLVVVTLRSLQGLPIEDYGYQLGRAWGIGQKDKSSGALLIVAATERQVRIEVGYGLEGTLTDALTKGIIEAAILPRFKAGDLPGGIKAGTAQIVQALGGADATGTPTQTGVDTANSQRAPAAPAALWPILVVVAAAAGLMIFCAAHGGGLCQGIMQVLFLLAMSGGGGRRGSGGGPSFSGGGGSFGGGGSSGSW